MREINKIYNEDCLVTMSKMPDNFIDLTVTSPPYDSLREYKGFQFDVKKTASELFRVTNEGGVVIWIVNDATINGSETCTSHKHALYFKKCGFNVETMIWEKTGSGCLGSNKFYAQNFEYMFVFTKGFPKTVNLICDRPNAVKSGKVTTNGGLDKEGKGKYREIDIKPFGKRTNIWKCDTQKNSEHPAPFPESLIKDHIRSWSNRGDLIFDPFMGSGTVGKIAYLLGRNYIGSEISCEYCSLAERRINIVKKVKKL